MLLVADQHSGLLKLDASWGQAIKALLAEEFPAMRRIETASLHRGIAGSQHSFLPVPPGSNKMQQLLQVRRHSRSWSAMCCLLEAARRHMAACPCQQSPLLGQNTMSQVSRACAT